MASEGLYQLSSPCMPASKVRTVKILNTEGLKVVEILKPTSQNPLQQSSSSSPLRTQVVFDWDLSLWNSGSVPIDKTSLHITALNSICKEGVYCYERRAWKRCYITRDGICIRIIEDVPEAGGQLCLWGAGIIMAKYMECCEQVRASLRGKSFLELGAGAGLTSMVASVLGARVYATEQQSCLAYLWRNVALNPDIELNVRPLGWAENSESSGHQFDFVCGCDVTYDPKMFLDLVKVIKAYLAYPFGVGLICHDDDSCPLSKFALKNLTAKCAVVGLSLEEIDYMGHLDESYANRTIRMWHLYHEDRNL